MKYFWYRWYVLKNSCISVTHTIIGVSVHTGYYIYYLSACNRGLFKNYYCYVLFLPFKKSLSITKNVFNPISIYSWKSISSLKIMRKKCLIRKIRYVCKNLLNLDYNDSIVLAFSQLLKNEEPFRKSFSFPFSANVLIEIQMLVLKTCKFLMLYFAIS